MKFVEIIDNDYKVLILVNIEQIAMIYPPNTILLSGQHGNGNGLINTDEIGMKRILEEIGIYKEDKG